jgi:hypothetical protein
LIFRHPRYPPRYPVPPTWIAQVPQVPRAPYVDRPNITPFFVVATVEENNRQVPSLLPTNNNQPRPPRLHCGLGHLDLRSSWARPRGMTCRRARLFLGVVTSFHPIVASKIVFLQRVRCLDRPPTFSTDRATCNDSARSASLSTSLRRPVSQPLNTV